MKYFPESLKGDYGKKRTNICHTPDERLLELKENVQNEDGGINMCGAVDQMIAEGMERGIAREKVWGIRNMIEVCKELGGTYDNTQFQVEMRYHLSKEESGKYMKQYWK